MENTTPLHTGHTHHGVRCFGYQKHSGTDLGKALKQVSCQNLPVPTKKFVPVFRPPYCVCVAAFAYAALCDTILPKAKQLCWSREDCFILYNIESLVVKYLLLVAYPQPKLVESGSTLITGMHSSDRFRINQRKGWPQWEQLTNTGKPFYQEKENTHVNSAFRLSEFLSF